MHATIQLFGGELKLITVASRQGPITSTFDMLFLLQSPSFESRRICHQPVQACPSRLTELRWHSNVTTGCPVITFLLDSPAHAVGGRCSAASNISPRIVMAAVAGEAPTWQQRSTNRLQCRRRGGQLHETSPRNIKTATTWANCPSSSPCRGLTSSSRLSQRGRDGAQSQISSP